MTQSAPAELATPVDYRVDAAGVAWITLNRPERLNAITDELLTDLIAALDRAGREGSRVIVLRGAGRAFCAGHDLVQDEQPDASSRAWAEGLQEVTRAIRRAAAPVVAAVHGHAVGGGFEFALAADLVVAANTATFRFPEVGIGLSVTGGITLLLPRMIGPLRAKQLVLLGEPLGAEEALRLGLVNWVVEEAELPGRVDQVVAALLTRPASSLTLAKRALDAGLDSTLDAQLELEVAHLLIAVDSPAAEAGRDAFRARPE